MTENTNDPIHRFRPIKALSLLFVFGLVAAACGSSTSDAVTETGSDGGDAAAASCETLPLKTDGVLSVATGEAVFPPWVEDDDAASGKGFESALVYALAEKLGVETVEWTGVGFDEAIAAGEKDYDFNIQQYSITAERDEVVDFSDGYYEVKQAIIGLEDSSVASAASVGDLADAKLGAAIGTTSLDYIESVIQPTTEAAVYDDNAAAKLALEAGQVDAVVFDLPTAYFVTAVEIPEAKILGVLPVSDAPEELGMLFEEGSPLVACVNAALGELKADGTLAALEDGVAQPGWRHPGPGRVVGRGEV